MSEVSSPPAGLSEEELRGRLEIAAGLYEDLSDEIEDLESLVRAKDALIRNLSTRLRAVHESVNPYTDGALVLPSGRTVGFEPIPVEGDPIWPDDWVEEEEAE